MIKISHIKFIFDILISKDQQRHLIKWIKSINKNYVLQNCIPWAVYDAIEYINYSLPNNSNIFEYGSGGSTLYWEKFNAKVVSIEHDKKWYNIVKLYIKESYNIDYRLVLPEKDDSYLNKSFDNPYHYISSDLTYKGYCFKQYASQIDTFNDEFFDLIFIDGRARPSCVIHSIRKVKKGGGIVLDNSEVNHYAKILNFLENNNFELIHFYGVLPSVPHMSQTTICIKQ